MSAAATDNQLEEEDEEVVLFSILSPLSLLCLHGYPYPPMQRLQYRSSALVSNWRSISHFFTLAFRGFL